MKPLNNHGHFELSGLFYLLWALFAAGAAAWLVGGWYLLKLLRFLI
jgi:hypothetical protein